MRGFHDTQRITVTNRLHVLEGDDVLIVYHPERPVITPRREHADRTDRDRGDYENEQQQEETGSDFQIWHALLAEEWIFGLACLEIERFIRNARRTGTQVLRNARPSAIKAMTSATAATGTA
jgi:hypothetical protein